MRRDGELKKQHERAAGDRFMKAYSRRTRRQYRFAREGDDPPDLVYVDGRGRELGVEMKTAYYDRNDAQAAWDVARGKRPTTRWTGRDIEVKLADFVTGLLCRLTQNVLDVPYPCLLVIDVRPPLTTERDLRRSVLPSIATPAWLPFSEAWLGVDLPIGVGRPSRYEGQYRIYRLHPK